MPEMVPLCAKAVVRRERREIVMNWTMMSDRKRLLEFRGRIDLLACLSEG